MAATRDVFSKVVPNVKLATTFDADGKEIQVERRHDPEQEAKQLEMFDILVAAGYFRARIKGLSAFDKIVGGMTWCIEACDYDVDVDLLFHENLSIGQKISLTEKIVIVLPAMKCPYQIEPHQIQGLDFINVFPVVQWLVKRSVENRAEKASRLSAFAVGQFHNHFRLESERGQPERHLRALDAVRQVQQQYGPRRQYKRRDAGPDDERTRVRVTLLEYGNNGLFAPRLATPTAAAAGGSAAQLLAGGALPSKGKDAFGQTPVDGDASGEAEMLANEIDVAKLLKSLYVANEDECINTGALTAAERRALNKHHADLKTEMSIDTKQLSERSQVKSLQTNKAALERKLQRLNEENRAAEKRLLDERHQLAQLTDECKEMRTEIRAIDAAIAQHEDSDVLQNVQQLVVRNEELKQQELKYKEQCREEIAKLEQDIRSAQHVTTESDQRDAQRQLDQEKERLQTARLQLAKKNRQVVSIQRQIDNIPDRTELAQYQRRFLELYNQVNAKHRETKQFFTLYNTLEDTKTYMSKELSLLSSIHDNYTDGMSTAASREHFLKQLDTIVGGVKQTRTKVRNRCEDEKAKRDGLNAQMACLVEQQRKYAAAVKEFTTECRRNEEWLVRLKALSALTGAAPRTAAIKA